jgi:hypothetical protein
MMKDNQSLILAGEKEELIDLGHQLKSLLPGGTELTENQAISVGNYAALAKANPFRGEVYGYQDRSGKLVLVDGYKLLVRWAKKISEYDEDYSDRLPVGAEDIQEGDIGYRLTIMRHDKKSGIKEYVALGASFDKAFALVSSSAVGVVRKAETFNSYKKKSIPPPKGWTWDEVARKRALKNVLNRAYAMPSIEELAKLNWEVDGQDTIPEDWAGPKVYQSTEEAEAHALLAAQERERQEKVDGMDEKEREAYTQEIETATKAMRDNGDNDLVGDEPPPLSAGMEASTKFWMHMNSLKIPREQAGALIQAANGDFDKALKDFKKAQART